MFPTVNIYMDGGLPTIDFKIIVRKGEDYVQRDHLLASLAVINPYEALIVALFQTDNARVGL